MLVSSTLVDTSAAIIVGGIVASVRAAVRVMVVMTNIIGVVILARRRTIT